MEDSEFDRKTEYWFHFSNKKRGVTLTPRYYFEWMVELIGIEPTTSWLPEWWAMNLISSIYLKSHEIIHISITRDNSLESHRKTSYLNVTIWYYWSQPEKYSTYATGSEICGSDYVRLMKDSSSLYMIAGSAKRISKSAGQAGVGRQACTYFAIHNEMEAGNSDMQSTGWLDSFNRSFPTES